MSPTSEVGPELSGSHSRRAFLVGSGGDIGAVAATVVTPAAALALERSAAASSDTPPVPVANASERLPEDPVMAYVSDAERGEVTVLSGTRETTFHDPAVVRRLLRAARSHTS